jgi:hypothetical protein
MMGPGKQSVDHMMVLKREGNETKLLMMTVAFCSASFLFYGRRYRSCQWSR